MTARKHLKVVRLRKPKIADDTRIIETLVWLLDKARSGKVTGYAIICQVDGMSIEAACPFSELDRLHVLGMIEKMKMNYYCREWPTDDAIDRGYDPL